MFPLLRAIFLCLALIVLAGAMSPLLAAAPVAVRVKGVEGELLKNVQAALSPPDGLVRDGMVDRLWLEQYVVQAEAKTRTALEPFGYYHVGVSTALTGSEKDGYILNVMVIPGEPVRLTEVIVETQGPGAAEEALKSAVAAFPLQKGGVLLHQKYESGKGEILSRIQALGYLDAGFTTHEIRVSPATGSARITLILKTGPRYRFGEVTFEGAPLFPEELLQRYLAFKTGAPFSYDRLGRTQSNFVGSGFFREVTVLPRKDEAVDLLVPISVSLKPSPKRTIRPGVGYGTDTGFRGSVSYKELNLFQMGHVLTVEATVAQNFQGIGAKYVIPSPLNLRTQTGIQVNLQREEVTTYLSTLAALEVNRTYSFGGGRIGTAYVRLQYEQFTVGLQDTSARLVMPGLRFSARKFDNIIRPTSGYNYSLELRGTHQILGSDTGFIQTIAEGAYLTPLPARLTLTTRAKVGATWQDDRLAELPVSIRFFAGGDTSVRGYAFKSLGPKNIIGEVIGGPDLLQGSLELERALFESWGVSLFYDVGNAFQSFSDFRLYQGAGVGLHYYTRVGGLNLSLARQIGVTDPGFRVHFSIGFQP
jgi:translocation and assembly module TamA